MDKLPKKLTMNIDEQFIRKLDVLQQITGIKTRTDLIRFAVFFTADNYSSFQKESKESREEEG